MNAAIQSYNAQHAAAEAMICNQLLAIINIAMPGAECKIWHAHPVWFLDGNPVVGYSKQKAGIRLMFWSGADFNEPALNVVGKKFKDASIFYNEPAQVHAGDIRRWLKKSTLIQWDYKNIVKRKGKLEKIEIK